MNYLLSGKLFCGECGANMQGESGTGRHGGKFYYYTCTARKREHTCKKANVKKDWLERIVTSTIVETVLRDEAVCNAIADELMRMQAESSQTTVVNTLKHHLSSIENSIRNLIKALERGNAPDTVVDRISELENEKNALQVKITQEDAVHIDFTRETVMDWLHQLRDGEIDNLEYREKVIDTFVNSVYVYDDRMTVVFNCADGNDTITIHDLDDESPSDSDDAETPANTRASVHGGGFGNCLNLSTNMRQSELSNISFRQDVRVGRQVQIAIRASGS